MSCSVEFMGLSLKHPVIVAAGPWARDGASIQRCVDAGAAAVVTETITLEANPVLRPRLYYDRGRLFNTKLYSDLHLEQWEGELEQVRLGQCRLIASIWATSPSELAYLAARMERMGAHAVEISISAPIGTRTPARSSDPDQVREFVRAAALAVDVPVMVKLSYEAASSPAFLQAIREAGAAGVSAIDALRGIQGVDLDARRPRMPTYGGYSGPSIRPVALAAAAILKQYSPLPLCSVGGDRDRRAGIGIFDAGRSGRPGRHRPPAGGVSRHHPYRKGADGLDGRPRHRFAGAAAGGGPAQPDAL